MTNATPVPINQTDHAMYATGVSFSATFHPVGCESEMAVAGRPSLSRPTLRRKRKTDTLVRRQEVSFFLVNPCPEHAHDRHRARRQSGFTLGACVGPTEL